MAQASEVAFAAPRGRRHDEKCCPADWEERADEPADAVGRLFGADPEGVKALGGLEEPWPRRRRWPCCATSELRAPPRSGFDASGSGKEGSGAAVTGAGHCPLSPHPSLMLTSSSFASGGRRGVSLPVPRLLDNDAG